VVVAGESVLGPVAAARETMLTTEMQEVCCSVSQCVAVCHSVLQCAAVCCLRECFGACGGSERDDVDERNARGVLQCVAVCCSVSQCVAVCCSVLQSVAEYCSVLQCVAECCGVWQCFEDGHTQGVSLISHVTL